MIPRPHAAGLYNFPVTALLNLILFNFEFNIYRLTVKCMIV